MVAESVLTIEQIEEQTLGSAEITVLVGRVGETPLTVGDSLVIVDGAGNEESVVVAGVMVDRDGYRVTDFAAPGDAAKLILRRRDPTLEVIVGVVRAPG